MDKVFARVREAVHFTNVILGSSVAVDDQEGWRITRGGIYLGESYYESMGFSSGEAQTMILLDTWSLLRLPGYRKRESLRAKLLERSEADALASLVDRIETAFELSLILPSFLNDFRVVMGNHVASDIRNLALQEQWLLMVLTRFLGDSVTPECVPEVNAEWNDLLALDPNPVWFSLRQSTDPARRMLHLIGLIGPAYFRLALMNAGMNGLTTLGAAPADSLNQDSVLDFGAQSSGQESASKDSHAEELSSDEERKIKNADTNEGSDLFESSATAPVQAILNTPISTRNPVDLEAHLIQSSTKKEGFGYDILTARDAEDRSSLSLYLERANRVSRNVDQLRAAWVQKIKSRRSVTRSLSRRRQKEGELLDTENLAEIIAAARGGSNEVRAFMPLQKSVRSREGIEDTDYYLVLDRSASMKNILPAIADIAIILVESLARVREEFLRESFAGGSTSLNRDGLVKLRTSVVVFDSNSRFIKTIEEEINDDIRIALIRSISVASGTTNDYTALNMIREQLIRSDNRKSKSVVILLGDGESSDQERTADAIKELEAVGARVWGIGYKTDLFVKRMGDTGRRIDEPRELYAEIAEIVGKDF